MSVIAIAEKIFDTYGGEDLTSVEPDSTISFQRYDFTKDHAI